MTPNTTYYAVIFTANRTKNIDGYKEMSENLYSIAKDQPGFLGIESVEGDFEITISYWKDLNSITKWKSHPAHIEAQTLGAKSWHKDYKVKITKVEREYTWEKSIS